MTLSEVQNFVAGPDFTPLDQALAEELGHWDGKDRPELFLAVALLSQACGNGHSCLDLAAAPVPTQTEGVSLSYPSPKEWGAILRQSPVVGAPGEYQPLVLDGKRRLYFQRFHLYETRIASHLLKKAYASLAQDIDPAALQTEIEKLLPGEKSAAQRNACRVALTRAFCVITGGPGTGKTFAAGQVVALFRKLSSAEKKRVALVAPTGKAAARLQESIQQALRAAGDSDAPPEAQTLHRFLGANRDGTAFRHGPGDPAPAELVIVDEASMLDLALMDRLLGALHPSARLILLGDQDQLASVEAGSVLGDICAADSSDGGTSPVCEKTVGHRSSVPSIRHGTQDGCPTIPAEVRPAVGGLRGDSLQSCMVRLDRSHRFDAQGEIRRLSQAVRNGEAEAAIRILRTARAEVGQMDLPSRQALPGQLNAMVLPRLKDQLQATTPAEALERLTRFRILCALRKGPYGAEQANLRIEEILVKEGLIPRGEPWYAGRPVLITANDYAARLFNGDLGVIYPDPSAGGLPMAWFAGADGALRSFAPERLPRHETAFALTVHKSQGSEFDAVLLMLSDRMAPVLTRELVYTGLTRAKSRAEIWCHSDILSEAIRARVRRMSGLHDLLSAVR